MLLFRASDIAEHRKVILDGRTVTVIDLAGSKVKIAEDGLWHEYTRFRPLAHEDLQKAHTDAVVALVGDKSIAALRTLDNGFEFVLEDNSRILINYSKRESLTIKVLDSNGQKVL